MSGSSRENFITPLDLVGGWPGDDAIVRSACFYDVEQYDESLFDTLGIVKPKQLLRAVTKRKAEFLAGRYCARRALGQSGLPSYCIGIGRHRQPIWPEGMCGAISHARQLAIAVVTRDTDIYGVGVDVEEEMTSAAVLQIQPFVLNADEYSLLSQHLLPPEQLTTLIYSIKESFFKAAFPLVQHYFDFDAISLLEIDIHQGVCCFRINVSLHPVLPQGKRLRGQFSFPRVRGLDTCTIATLVILTRETR